MDEKSAFKDLRVWQKGLEYANAVIDVSETLVSERKHYRLIEQLEAAATSVPMNIAEGRGRQSAKEFRQFLFIARGSLYETITLLEIFKMRKWITANDAQILEEKSIEIAKMLNSLISSIKTTQ